MRTEIKDTFSNLMLNIRSIYKDNSMIYHFCLKERILQISEAYMQSIRQTKYT